MKIVKRSYKKSSKFVQLVCVGRNRNQKQICSDTKAHILLIVAHKQTHILTFSFHVNDQKHSRESDGWAWTMDRNY